MLLERLDIYDSERTAEIILHKTVFNLGLERFFLVFEIYFRRIGT